MFTHTKSFSSFSVNDLQKARVFYKDVLGLNVRDLPMGLIELRTNNGQTIMVYPKQNHVPATFTVLNFVVKNIEEAVDALTAKGVRFEHYAGTIETNEKGIFKNADGSSIAWFKDPGENFLSVIEER